MYDAPSKSGLFKSLEDTDKGEFSIVESPPSSELSHIDDLGVIDAGGGIFFNDHRQTEQYYLWINQSRAANSLFMTLKQEKLQ